MSQMATARVKLLSSRIVQKFDTKGQANGVLHQADGDVVQMPADEAQRYIDKGLAAPVPKDQPRK